MVLERVGSGAGTPLLASCFPSSHGGPTEGERGSPTGSLHRAGTRIAPGRQAPATPVAAFHPHQRRATAGGRGRYRRAAVRRRRIAVRISMHSNLILRRVRARLRPYQRDIDLHPVATDARPECAARPAYELHEPVARHLIQGSGEVRLVSSGQLGELGDRTRPASGDLPKEVPVVPGKKLREALDRTEPDRRLLIGICVLVAARRPGPRLHLAVASYSHPECLHRIVLLLRGLVRVPSRVLPMHGRPNCVNGVGGRSAADHRRPPQTSPGPRAIRERHFRTPPRQ